MSVVKLGVRRLGYQFRDPIHGMIDVSNEEVQLIKLPAFQRLRYIRQLGTSYMVYHGAEHTRFSHSLGVMHLISEAMDSLNKRNELDFSPDEYSRLRQLGRIVGLLHDVGHGPFSHVGEDSKIYPIIRDVDNEERSGHEVYTRLLVRDYFGNHIDRLFKDRYDITKEDVLSFLSDMVTDKRYYFIKDLISGQIDADRMDYLLRDSYYCGVQYGKYDLHRLLDTLCICNPGGNPRREWQLGVELDGVHAVEGFIFARYWMFIQVCFHKTRRIYDYYLTEFVKFIMNKEYGNGGVYPQDINDYILCNDNKVIQQIEQCASMKVPNKWAFNLYNREHLKEAFVSTPHPEEPLKQNKNKEKIEKDELDRIAWVLKKANERFVLYDNPDQFYVDQSKTSSSKYLIDVPIQKEEGEEEEDNLLYAIPVRNKKTGIIKPIQDYSVPIKSISDRRKINILRIYAHESVKNEVCNFCYNMYEVGYNQYIEEIRHKKAKIIKEMEEINAFEQEDNAYREKIKS